MNNPVEYNQVMYHLGLSKKNIAEAQYVLLPGDPGRVESIAQSFTNPKFLAKHREYTSWLAYAGDLPVLICSTGMGGPSVSICVEELAQLGVKNFIRVGTTGAIQPQIELGDLIINDAAVRLDGASKHYAPIEFPAVADLALTNILVEVAEEEKIPYHVGISVSSDTFWPGQERYDSYSGYVIRAYQGSLAEWRSLGAYNYEMETATLFIVAKVLGLRAASICGVVAQRGVSENISSADIYNRASERFIKVVHRALNKLNLRGKK
ncbi:MAG TPA: uridine phosphorylase [Candidatus Avacidaminococcus intestinavium]|uniref:Uridine phosphorylase n=1 Tax=Candidatus Avacidaminococcus intestinavium TaxID=2840684 RepID=A0A9D1SLP2_9FIRM|nr:uridine phosphorylase [Candidatus Avacidaminococcus intestinavium]